jgi:hypothetical protein
MFSFAPMFAPPPPPIPPPLPTLTGPVFPQVLPVPVVTKHSLTFQTQQLFDSFLLDHQLKEKLCYVRRSSVPTGNLITITKPDIDNFSTWKLNPLTVASASSSDLLVWTSYYNCHGSATKPKVYHRQVYVRKQLRPRLWGTTLRPTNALGCKNYFVVQTYMNRDTAYVIFAGCDQKLSFNLVVVVFSNIIHADMRCHIQ